VSHEAREELRRLRDKGVFPEKAILEALQLRIAYAPLASPLSNDSEQKTALGEGSKAASEVRADRLSQYPCATSHRATSSGFSR
jgi:hypothetical protein